MKEMIAIFGTLFIALGWVGYKIYKDITPHFKAGDCVMNEYHERWDEKANIKIIEVGNYHYLWCFEDAPKHRYDDEIYTFDKKYIKTECE